MVTAAGVGGIHLACLVSAWPHSEDVTLLYGVGEGAGINRGVCPLNSHIPSPQESRHRLLVSGCRERGLVSQVTQCKQSLRKSLGIKGLGLSSVKRYFVSSLKLQTEQSCAVRMCEEGAQCSRNRI